MAPCAFWYSQRDFLILPPQVAQLVKRSGKCHHSELVAARQPGQAPGVESTLKLHREAEPVPSVSWLSVITSNLLVTFCYQ